MTRKELDRLAGVGRMMEKAARMQEHACKNTKNT